MVECETADDLNVVDHLEPVRVTIGGETFDVSALRRPLTPTVEDDVVTRRANWHIAAGDLSADPAAGSTLLTLSPGLSETWTVEHAERMTLGNRWKLHCTAPGV